MQKPLILAATIALCLLDAREPNAAARPGVQAPWAPRQVAVEVSAIVRDGYRIAPFADFALDARILAREDYRFDTEADLSPTDLVLGWGRMSDDATLAGFSISQANRWYYLSYYVPPPIPESEFLGSSANMHFIPANDAVAARLAHARPGQIASIRGKLVDIDRIGRNWHWRSSRSREDTGEGSCEVVWLESLELR